MLNGSPTELFLCCTGFGRFAGRNDGIGQRFFNDSQHELDEWCGFPLGIGKVDHLIVFLLVVMDNGFYRKPGKQRVPLRQQKGMPEPPIRPLPSENG